MHRSAPVHEAHAPPLDPGPHGYATYLSRAPRGTPAMGEGIPFRRLDEFRVEIPRSFNPRMRTDALLFADEKMVEIIRNDESPIQAANVATMPGIVGKAMAMPDIHQGHGVPIGGVAA